MIDFHVGRCRNGTVYLHKRGDDVCPGHFELFFTGVRQETSQTLLPTSSSMEKCRKSSLQELCQKNHLPAPIYRCEESRDENGKTQFQVRTCSFWKIFSSDVLGKGRCQWPLVYGYSILYQKERRREICRSHRI